MRRFVFNVWNSLVAVGSCCEPRAHRLLNYLWLGFSALLAAVYLLALPRVVSILALFGGTQPWWVCALRPAWVLLLALWLMWRLPARTPTPLEYRQGRIVAIISVLLGGAFALAVTLNLLLPLSPAADIAPLYGSLSLAGAGLALWLVRHGVVRGGAVTLLMLLLLHFPDVLNSNDVLVLSVLLLLVGGLLVRWWVGMVLAIGLPVLAAIFQSQSITEVSGVAGWAAVVNIVVLLELVAGFIAVYARSLEQALATADTRAQELEHAQATLAAAYAVVEQRVEERTHLLAASEQRLRDALARLEHTTRTDDLTGLYNRRAWRELSALEVDRHSRTGATLAVLLVDVDHFKRVNDTYGHAVGDGVLQAVAEHLRAATRSCDLVARYGGEEFVILLSDTSPDAALVVAERVRHTINAQPLVDGINMFITVSIGVAAQRAAQPALETVLQHADDALYRAKRTGRNCVGVYNAHIPAVAS